VFKFLPLVLLGGCATTHNPKPSDTEFNGGSRNWLSIYREELNIAIKNDDNEACYFFLQEIVKIEFKSLRKEPLKANPKIRIIK